MASVVESGAPRSSEDFDNIWVAATNGDIEAVRHFLSQGTSVNVQDEDTGNSPIHSAASYGQVRMIEYLIENGADVNLRDSDGDTPILLCEDPATFEVLETNGANLNVKNNSNEGFLEKATELAQEENTEMVTYLFNRDLIPVNFAIQNQLDSDALVDEQQIYSPTRDIAATAHARKDNSPKQP